ncbi:MAG: tRNA (adenosine(37)-N6)-threonylcarbamoyltransferase complex dimerization subunit type 1 TsaB [Sedimentisphaerales bacterium]|nr:tRNA (adenosine(37)-N6)-threonylcarbamoyltransferase complex dimerization subunit type 1 TsaB [Sedimentisphaerales bacterium]
MTAKKPLILAIETSGRWGSVALALGEQLLIEQEFTGPMRHNAELFPAISLLLRQVNEKPKHIEQIYISAGPGSFTGLRIAVALAKMANFANDVKIIALDTLDVIAANVSSFVSDRSVSCKTKLPQRVAVILDAKRNQFFAAVYRHADGDDSHKADSGHNRGRCNPLAALDWPLIKITDDCIITAANFVKQFTHQPEPLWLLGEGLVYYKNKFVTRGIKFFSGDYWRPRAQKVHELGWFLAQQGRFADPTALRPKYLRRPDVKMNSML